MQPLQPEAETGQVTQVSSCHVETQMMLSRDVVLRLAKKLRGIADEAWTRGG